MRVLLAGLNLDTGTLSDLRRLGEEAREALVREDAPPARRREIARALGEVLDSDSFTPETLSAAYARISRDPRPVDDLRRESRREVSRSRRSNERIIFGLGHASVAEHAVFNLDILDISRLAAEFVERFRLCSYTEKSQRYVQVEGGHVVPDEVRGTPVEADFERAVGAQNGLYLTLIRRLAEVAREEASRLGSDTPPAQDLEQRAREDARYALCLATRTQLGMTANARNIERILTLAAAHPLAEIRRFGEALRRTMEGVAPSLIRYGGPDSYQSESLPQAAGHLRRSFASSAEENCGSARGIDRSFSGGGGDLAQCRVVAADGDGESRIFASWLHEVERSPFDDCLRWASGLGAEQKGAWVLELAGKMEPFHPLPRVFEYADITFEAVVSASCFAQLKRHRMGTLTAQDYHSDLGYTTPPSVASAGMCGEFDRVMGVSDETARKVERVAGPLAAAYVRTNAHRRRVLFKVNLREAAHFMRLRRDPHAQWDIRSLAESMARDMERHFPSLSPLFAGKDQFVSAMRSETRGR